MWACGAAIGVKMFNGMHSTVIVLMLLLLWGCVMIVFGFSLSAFFSDSSTAYAMTLLLILLTVECGFTIVIILIGAQDVIEADYILYMLVPQFPLERGIMAMANGAYVDAPVTTSNWISYNNGHISVSLLYLFGHLVFWSFAVWYLDNVGVPFANIDCPPVRRRAKCLVSIIP